ncbi:MAG: helix-hairpin-helix domain-containing protein [Saprospiraceae bacterium]|nr:helix-hairpin-helix domain-containing protein [Saprospiraceae bacterium]MDW8231005.1 helix-hairpin-helix domain-containing protein [Saprospiraceae bacterium]
MPKKIQNYLYFLPVERRAFNALLLVVGVVFAAPWAIRYFWPASQTDFSAIEQRIAAWQGTEVPLSAPDGNDTPAELFPFDPNTASVETLVRLGVPARVAQTIQRYRERGGRFRSADDLGKIYTLPPDVFERLRPYVRIGQGQPSADNRSKDSRTRPPAEVFPFDPNAASREELLRLGLPPALVERLLRYREKGGIFRQKSDFQKLYGLSEADYARLEPYIVIARPEVAAVVRPAAYSSGASTREYSPKPIDVNTADANAWTSLPGIGSARANSILKFRDRLGGFVSVEQVSETFGLPDSVFQQIRPWLRAETPIYRKIDLNTALEKDLSAHPYINYQQARLIVAYREQHGPYKKPDDIRRIAAFTDAGWLAKVIPYLEATQ